LTEYAGDLTTPAPLLGGETQSTPDPNCSTASCTPFELSQYDLWEWERSLDGASEVVGANNTGGLVSPTACITTTVPAGMTDRSGAYTIAIAWRGPTSLSDPTISTCGQGSGKYNSEGGGVDVHRRVLVVNTYISAH
jgi:type IV pilus assembly protein PilV